MSGLAFVRGDMVSYIKDLNVIYDKHMFGEIFSNVEEDMHWKVLFLEEGTWHCTRLN